MVGDPLSGTIIFGTYPAGKVESRQIVYSADPVEDSSPYKSNETNPLEEDTRFDFELVVGDQTFTTDLGVMLISDNNYGLGSDRLAFNNNNDPPPGFNNQFAQFEINRSRTSNTAPDLITTIDQDAGEFIFDLSPDDSYVSRLLISDFPGGQQNTTSFSFTVDPLSVAISQLQRCPSWF